jgi:hypothetical protein
MIYQESGIYQCSLCQHEQLDDFGKIKKYLDEHKGASAVDVAEGTGVKLEMVRTFLKDGRIQIPEGSKLFIRCERCGCALRHGRFCSDCTRELVGGLQATLFENMGEKPRELETKKAGNRMRYF